MKSIADMTLLAMRELGVGALPAFEELLRSSFDAHPVPFGTRWYGDAYRERARDPVWFLQSLISNASKEAEGSRRLWEIARHTEDLTIARQIRVHALDEARHARFYVAMARLTFPDAADGSLWRELSAMAPSYPGSDSAEPVVTEDLHHDFSFTLDELIQTNIGEIRTRIHQQLLRSVILKYAAAAARPRLEKLVDAVLRDETKHIAYTAVLVDKAMREGRERVVRDIMFERLQQFNQLTLAEVGAAAFEGS